MGLKPIMFVGTGSDVGKSTINTAICRILKQDGYTPAPFKAQNMSLNSFATADGLEIGRAQAVQAEACQLECRVEMNPVLLKPSGLMQSQVVLNGKPMGNRSAKAYIRGTDKSGLFEEALKGYRKLASQFNPIVLEGAGSISELNLRERDITNMRMAKAVGAATYLVADIDRGGVFASVYGTLELLPPDERQLIKGVIINKFRGDIELFRDGKTQLEELTGVPVVGILPYFNDIYIEEEDSVSLSKKNATAVAGKLNIAVVLLRYISNFTDFDSLAFVQGVNVYYTNNATELEKADIIILPGSKNTVLDMQALTETGLDKHLKRFHLEGKSLFGICGGYQLMGETIADPLAIESSIKTINGLGVLPVHTVLTDTKNSSRTSFRLLNGNELCQGYEIHMGQTHADSPSPLCHLTHGDTDGFLLNDKTWGTYIHGIFDNLSVLQHILVPFGISKFDIPDYQKFKQQEFDRLAEFSRQHIDMQAIYKSLND